MIDIETKGLSAGLGGTHWGLLPALLALPWLFVDADWAGRWLVLSAAVMASYDVAERRIPNVMNLITALGGLMYVLTAHGPAALPGALLSGLIGFGVMAVFFFIGAVGAGDVKAVGALAVFLSPMGAVYLIVFTTLAGGVMALIRLVMAGPGALLNGLGGLRRCKTGLEMPYGLAIWAGTMGVVLVEGLR